MRGGGRGASNLPAWKCSGQFCFQGKRKLLKILEWRKIFQPNENVQGKLCFQNKRKLLKIPVW